jgi:hypothetical protein
MNWFIVYKNKPIQENSYRCTVQYDLDCKDQRIPQSVQSFDYIFSQYTIIEPYHDKTNIMGPRSLIRIHTASLLVIGVVSKQHGSWSDCAYTQAGLDPCRSQTNYVGFVMERLKFINLSTSLLNKYICTFISTMLFDIE